jgi:hypothetical protein
MHGVGEELEDLLPFLQEVEVRLLQTDFIVPTSGQVTHYFKPERTKPPEFTEPVDVVVETPHWFSLTATTVSETSTMSARPLIY